MYLRSLELKHFRNFPEGRFEFSSGLNIFYGPNASGKTNLLEAIHLLSNLRSFRTRTLRDFLQWDEEHAYIRGMIQTEDAEVSSQSKVLALEFKPHERHVLLNSKPPTSTKEYLQIFPSTAFVPDDLSLIKGTPTQRRYFLDKGTFHFYPTYWAFLTDYNKVLRQKNALLRDMQRASHRSEQRVPDLASSADPCSIWNEQLQRLGSQIILRRLLFVRELQHFVHDVYAQWLGNQEIVEVRYKSSLGADISAVESRLASDSDSLSDQGYQDIFKLYGEAIQRAASRERRMGNTVIGPHRDDLNIYLSGHPLQAFGSQGQQRTAVLALKLAETYLYYKQYAEYPVLLLDDVTSELDMQRNNKLFECLQQGMQVFMSATSKLDFPALRSIPCAYFDLSQKD